MTFLEKIKYSQNWNIGFCEQTPDELVRDRALKPVRWLKHPYRDRWFADPFILKVTDEEIVVFVEECPMENPKGIICELVIDRRTMRLKDRYVLLEKDTHLSYPAIIRHEGKVYVYPENGASGELNIYEYEEMSHRLVNPVCLLDEAVADATIVKLGNVFYMSATKFPATQEKAFLYKSDLLFGKFVQIGEKPYQTSKRTSRQGGDWIFIGQDLYRPAQDCVPRYGSALSMMKSTVQESSISELPLFELSPLSFRYNRGLHTINFEGKVCVIDGYGYLSPILGRVYYSEGLRRVVGLNKKVR